MSCFGRFLICRSSKNDVVEIPDHVELESIAEESVITKEEPVVEKDASTEEVLVEIKHDSETVIDKLVENEPAKDLIEPIDEVCVYYGTISNAYNNENEYYILNNDPDKIIYFGRFPLEWAKKHNAGTGPNECERCFENGMYHDVFLGYCAECAMEEYKGDRGKGFISPGIDNYGNQSTTSVFDTYLKDVDLDLIGKDYIWYGLNVEEEYMVDYTDDDLVI